jgi:hypothetical protein
MVEVSLPMTTGFYAKNLRQNLRQIKTSSVTWQRSKNAGA